MPDALRDALEQFNRQAFFDCHETLEIRLWGPAPIGSPEKAFYQGLLQVGVGFYHLLRQNRVGARNLLRAGLEKLEPLQHQEPFSSWLDLVALVRESREILSPMLTTDMANAPVFTGALPRIIYFYYG